MISVYILKATYTYLFESSKSVSANVSFLMFICFVFQQCNDTHTTYTIWKYCYPWCKTNISKSISLNRYEVFTNTKNDSQYIFFSYTSGPTCWVIFNVMVGGQLLLIRKFEYVSELKQISANNSMRNCYLLRRI